MLVALSLIGRHARWVLVLGSVLILFLPSMGGAIRPTLPYLVALVLSLTMARIDLVALLRGWATPVHFLQMLVLVGVMLPGTAVLVFAVSEALGLRESTQLNLLVYALAAPIGSAAGMCFMLGWDAKRALEATLLATFVMPFVGPLVLGELLPGAVVMDTWDLLGRLVLIVGAATALSLIIRAVLSPAWIEGHAHAFDGATALVLLAFLLPVFDGVGALFAVDPVAWLRMLGFVCLLSLGASVLTIILLRKGLGAPVAGALGIMWGNRNVGIYLAALPVSADLSLFVALYQFPMYFTPLVLSALFIRRN